MSNSFKNSYKVSEKELVSLSVYNVGYQKCTPHYQWGPGIRDHYLIHHVVSGTGYYTVNNITYTLNSGDTFLIYPFDEVTYYADDSNPWEYCWVGFTGTDAKIILQATDFTKSSPVIHQSNMGDQIKRQLLHIYAARGSEFENAMEMTGRLYTTLALFMKGSIASRRDDSYQTYAKKGVEYIHSHYLYPITVEDIAEYVGISRSHLYRSFQVSLSQSPKDYLTDFRIKQACILLKQSSLSITAISKSVGFEDNLNFSKAFKKCKGLAPSIYAKEHI
ncbi:MAG: AraC family transcriptional regulator [Lachnospiraceae bacterium]|nr:AraC family transcriptional regulator [Lachnospiraceae bacterium]